MSKGVWALALSAALCLCPGRACAWNNHGHMVVAKIAYGQLSDGQKVKAATLLKAHPHYKEFLVKDKPRGVSDAEWAFLKAATWPDWVKGRKALAKFNHRELHFIDLPFVDERRVREEDRETITEENLKPKGKTILDGLKEFGEKLADAEAPAAERAIALCWVLHLVGDIHQPLHCATYCSSDFPKGDHGGNDQLVKVDGRVTKLHAYWDELIGRSNRYRVVEASADLISHDPKYKREAFKRELDRPKAADWADESFKLAVAVAYLAGDLKTQKLPHGHDEGDFDVPPLPPNYAARARAVAQGRVALAGYRLADRLKATLE
jgi:hypothetical protein